MQVALTIENETLQDLVSRVYAFDGAPSQDALGSAQQALLDANPYLDDLGDVPPGTVFAVPPTDGAQPSADTQDAGPTLGTISVQQLRGAVALTAQQLLDDLDAEIADARSAATQAKPGALKDVAGGVASFKEQLQQVAQAATARGQRAQALQRYQKQAFAQIDKDLAALATAFGGGQSPASE